MKKNILDTESNQSSKMTKVEEKNMININRLVDEQRRLKKQNINNSTTSKGNTKTTTNNKSTSKNKNSKNIKIKAEPRKLKLFFIVNSILGIIGMFTGLFLLYGPWNGFRDWLVTTAMTTMNHQYFATWFYDDETIDYVLSRNKVIESSTPSNPDLIEIKDYDEEEEEIVYANEYERQVLEKDPGNDDYKIIDIKGNGYEGYLAVIYDPSRVHTVVTSKLGVRGEYLVDMAKRSNALVAINGGGFVDPNFNSNGSTPLGITISNGEVKTSASYGGAGGIIGFTEDDKLVLGKYSLSQAQSMGIRDCVTFGPFLIVDGVSSEVLGNGGWGDAPRTAIGQRKDGIVLFLVLDGRRAGMMGADMDDLIEIMENYGAYNAANLDGGTSSVMAINGQLINDPIDSTGAHKTRWISTGFVLVPKEEEVETSENELNSTN